MKQIPPAAIDLLYNLFALLHPVHDPTKNVLKCALLKKKKTTTAATKLDKNNS